MYGGGFGFATVGAAVLAIFLVRWAIKSPKKDALPIEAILTAIIMVATIAQAAIAFENNKSSERGVETQKEAVKLQASQARIESLLANLTTAQGTSQLVLQDGYLVNQFFELPGENFTGPYHPQAVLTIVNRGLHATAIDDVQVIAHDRNGTAFEFPKTLLDSPTPIVNWSYYGPPPDVPRLTRSIESGEKVSFVVDLWAAKSPWPGVRTDLAHMADVTLMIKPVLGAQPSPCVIEAFQGYLGYPGYQTHGTGLESGPELQFFGTHTSLGTFCGPGAR